MAHLPPIKISARFCTQRRGWIAEVFGRRGELKHTTGVHESARVALDAAKEWVKATKRSKVGQS